MDRTEYQELFSSLKPMIWLAHSGVSPMSRAVADAVDAHNRDMMTHAASHLKSWLWNVKEVKRLTGGLINCSPKDIAVTPNTTHGINLIAHGLDWRPGDQVVIASKEYPANVYPWWAQESRGVEIVWVHPDQDERLPVEAFAEKLTDRTRVLSVSHVEFSSGYRNDLERLGKLCKQAGVIFVVDAIQSFSVLPIDVTEWGIDALTTGVHKWLCGPTGLATFYSTPELRDRLAPTWVGADAVVNASDYLDYRFELIEDARRFENAMLNFAGVAGVRAALEVVDGFGRENIETEIRKATDYFVGVLVDLGFQIHSSRVDEEWSGIVSATHPATKPETIAEHLKQDGIITTVRDDKLRLAPHAYHDWEDLERVGAVLEKCVKTTCPEV